MLADISTFIMHSTQPPADKRYRVSLDVNKQILTDDNRAYVNILEGPAWQNLCLSLRSEIEQREREGEGEERERDPLGGEYWVEGCRFKVKGRQAMVGFKKIEKVQGMEGGEVLEGKEGVGQKIMEGRGKGKRGKDRGQKEEKGGIEKIGEKKGKIPEVVNISDDDEGADKENKKEEEIKEVDEKSSDKDKKEKFKYNKYLPELDTLNLSPMMLIIDMAKIKKSLPSKKSKKLKISKIAKLKKGKISSKLLPKNSKISKDGKKIIKSSKTKSKTPKKAKPIKLDPHFFQDLLVELNLISEVRLPKRNERGVKLTI